MEKSILELTQHKDDPWLESAGISLYTANPVIPLPEITGMNFMAMTKRVMGEHHISMAELRAPANIEEEYSFLECLMICHQVIFLWDTDPLRQEEQLALFQRITEVVDLPRILVCINLYTRRGMGKHKIRRLLEKVAGTLGSIYTLEWSREDIEQARLCLCGGQFQLHKMSPKTLTAIEEVGNRIFPASSKKPRKRRKKG